jgi:hypothetical protein
MHVYAAEVLSKFGRVQRLRQVMKGEVKHVMRKLPGVFVKVKTFVGLDAWVSVSDMADLVRWYSGTAFTLEVDNLKLALTGGITVQQSEWGPYSWMLNESTSGKKRLAAP